MTIVSKKSVLFGLAFSGLMMATGSNAIASGNHKKDSHSHMKMAKAGGKCFGINKCAGKGECASKTTKCAGQNTCKGKGWLTKTKADCKKEGGKFEAKTSTM